MIWQVQLDCGQCSYDYENVKFLSIYNFFSFEDEINSLFWSITGRGSFLKIIYLLTCSFYCCERCATLRFKVCTKLCTFHLRSLEINLLCQILGLTLPWLFLHRGTRGLTGYIDKILSSKLIKIHMFQWCMLTIRIASPSAHFHWYSWNYSIIAEQCASVKEH